MTTVAAPTRDLTHEVAGVVDWFVNYCCDKPRICCGPWTVNFSRRGRAAITYRRPDEHALVVSEPGWYRFVWGPHLAKAAHYYWEHMAEDLAQVGIHVTVPSKERCQELYWGPMPSEEPNPDPYNVRPRSTHYDTNMTLAARAARAEFLAELRANAREFEPDWHTPRHWPDMDRRLARMAADRAAAEAGAPQDEPEPQPVESWNAGRWGKGFVSASGRTYTWTCTHPKDGGHPQHGAQQRLIEQTEGIGVLAKGRLLTGEDVIGYLCPVLIAPDGTYTRYSADSFWQGSEYLPEQTQRRDKLNEEFTPDAFASADARLRLVEDAEEFHAQALGQRTGYGHAGNVLDILNRKSK